MQSCRKCCDPAYLKNGTEDVHKESQTQHTNDSKGNSKQTVTDSKHVTYKKKQDGHSSRRDPLNTEVTQQAGQIMEMF